MSFKLWCHFKIKILIRMKLFCIGNWKSKYFASFDLVYDKIITPLLN